MGFKVDGRGRLIGEAWVPIAGLDADEWRVYVNAVAQACDRTEGISTLPSGCGRGLTDLSVMKSAAVSRSI